MKHVSSKTEFMLTNVPGFSKPIKYPFNKKYHYDFGWAHTTGDVGFIVVSHTYNGKLKITLLKDKALDKIDAKIFIEKLEEELNKSLKKYGPKQE